MRQLSKDKRVQIVNLLVEGMSLRAASRISGCSIVTVSRLLVSMGKACAKYHANNVVGLKSRRIQADEIWSFVYSKQKNVPEGMEDKAGDVWTWVAIDADSKLVVSWLVGDRGAECANEFLDDLASRLTHKIQLSTDGNTVYRDAVGLSFGSHVDYGQIKKIFGPPHEKEKRYSPVDCISVEKKVISGSPDVGAISTSYVERQNLTMRMCMRRFTRLTNGFSKKVENHCHALALHYMYYNFCRIHKTLRVTPAMEVGLTQDVWEVEDLVGLLS